LEKDSLFRKCFWESWICTCRRLNPYLSLCTKIYSKWTKDVYIRPETLKLLEENIGETLEDTDIGNYFLNRTPIAQEIRAKINK
jgi:hypothetical protein